MSQEHEDSAVRTVKQQQKKKRHEQRWRGEGALSLKKRLCSIAAAVQQVHRRDRAASRPLQRKAHAAPGEQSCQRVAPLRISQLTAEKTRSATQRGCQEKTVLAVQPVQGSHETLPDDQLFRCGAPRFSGTLSASARLQGSTLHEASATPSMLRPGCATSLPECWFSFCAFCTLARHNVKNVARAHSSLHRQRAEARRRALGADGPPHTPLPPTRSAPLALPGFRSTRQHST